MSGRDLYRNVLQCNAGFSTDCPAGMSGDMSPMSTLAVNLWHGASVSQTPRRRLSLGSSSSDTSVPAISPTALSFRDSISSDSDCSDILSPSRRRLSIDKENHHSPYFTPSSSSSSAIPHRLRTSPLKEVQNTVERNISPQKKQQLLSPSKRLSIRAQFTSPPKKLEVPLPDDFDTNSQDSGYSESGKKYEDTGFSVPVTCAPRKLNLDFSPPKQVSGHSVSPVKNFLTSIFSSSSDAKTVCVPSNTLPAVTTLPQSSTPVTSVAKSKAKSTSNAAQEERTPFRTFSSLINKDKEEDEDPFLMELLDDINTQEDQPSGMSSLLKAPINTSTPSSVPSSTATSISQRLSMKLDTPITHKPSIRRCLSMMDTTPTSITAQSNLEPSISFKRPNPPADLNSLVECKRRRSDDVAVSENKEAPQEPQPTSTRPPLFPFRQLSNPESSRPSGAEARPKLQRCHSESHVSIMKAVSRSTQDQTLIGDCSKPYVLPLINSGKHPDLKAISVDTMASLLRGDFDDRVASYTILDCRYPYEYEGGHIVSGVNWPHPGKVVEFLEEKKGAPVGPCEKAPRNILIFHCEFSAERGPRALRQLREKDRSTNKDYYPALHFPEIYLLEGGYKAFYERYPELCVPTEYTRMLDPKHSEDLKHFRAKSKSWAAENKHAKQGRLALISRPGLKRLTLQ